MASLTFVNMAEDTSKKPLMALGKIPSIDLLKEFLGLNAAPVKVKNAFRDITVEWRKTNTTSDNRPATELVDWHSPAVQKDLYTLAEKFLADNDNAERYWSASRPWKYDSNIQYPDDKERIVELLVQLFFKQNKHYKNNTTYSQWARKDLDSEPSRESSTQQRMASSDAASEKESEKSSYKPRRSENAENRLSPTSNFIDISGDLSASPTLPWDNKLPSSRDIYDIPDEEEPVVAHGSPSLSSTLSTKHNRTEEVDEGRTSKRRAKYGLRARTHSRFNDAISDKEFEELLRAMESDDSSEDEGPPRNVQRAPVAPMMNHPDFETSTPQSAKRHETGLSDRGQIQDKPNGKPDLGSSQMPPPPRSAQATPLPRPRKTHKVTPQVRNRSVPCSGTSTKPRGKLSSTATTTHQGVGIAPHSKSSSKTLVSSSDSKKSNSAKSQERPNISANTKVPSTQHESYTFILDPDIDGFSHGVDLGDDPVEPRRSSKQLAPSIFQQYQQPSCEEESASGNSPSVEAHSRSQSQTLSSGHIDTGKTPPVTAPATTQMELSHDEAGHNNKAKAPSQGDASSKPRPKTQLEFIIVVREPRVTKMFWPEGKIQGTSLSDFIAGVAKATQRDNIERLDLTLKTTTSDTKAPVARDDEDSWLVAKRLFTESLKEARMKAKLQGLSDSANPQIYIEPFYGQVRGVEGVQQEEEEDDEDISFF